ncbi:unnamed protein product [Kuraishia capsulata CBS 1993]|uniref:FAM86 N-terminal domain-containing protein n=1 Tax=Kuraishia capsulata CBS 1993 TaxID=1382522 RepID=W6MNV9_9ASCO|nr:uncharacterized protein KUCA_T00002721001 [Kuraishia capsulata CBS 1993]CDK26747.1 unnamed protein product [Kuraishia capsulata CBS 1993]
MDSLIRKIRQRVPVKYLEDISTAELALNTQRLLRECELIANRNPYYILTFLKSAIKRLEQDNCELDDELFEFFSELLGAKPLSPTDFEVITYSIKAAERVEKDSIIEINESPQLISGYGTTGRRTWEAALYLSNYLLENPDLVPGKTVLELGAGTGLVSLALGKYTGASSIVVTDGDANLIENLGATLKLNNISKDDPKWIFQSLLWGEDQVPDGVDILVGADITYDSTIIPVLLQTITAAFLQNPNLVVYISATIRNEETIAVWDNSIAQSDIQCSVISYSSCPNQDLKDSGIWYSVTTPEIRIYELRK